MLLSSSELTVAEITSITGRVGGGGEEGRREGGREGGREGEKKGGREGKKGGRKEGKEGEAGGDGGRGGV